MNTEKVLFGATDKNGKGLSFIPSEVVDIEFLNGNTKGSDYQAYEVIDISNEGQTI